jgi:hypothetical protein
VHARGHQLLHNLEVGSCGQALRLEVCLQQVLQGQLLLLLLLLLRMLLQA